MNSEGTAQNPHGPREESRSARAWWLYCFTWRFAKVSWAGRPWFRFPLACSVASAPLLQVELLV